ncbi:MAG: BACON domain-containing protein, partial [Lentimicrobiaceae bacterium]|nr:BACON domain-containing protein [Lentimicrobiaceae bacterium]
MKILLKLTAFLLILLVALASSCQPEEPKEIEYTILPASLNFDATGGEDKFTVTVTSPAIVESVESLSAWCQVSTNGVSPVNVMVTVDPYTYYEARTTTVVVNMKLGENKTSTTVQITQAGVEIPEWVLIDGIKWATRNVDMPGTFAAKPEDPGMFYQWNRKVGWSATDPMINSNGDTTWDSSVPLGWTWEEVNDPCPPGWRLPMLIELESIANTGGQWTTLNDVNGFVFSSDSKLLFL